MPTVRAGYRAKVTPARSRGENLVIAVRESVAEMKWLTRSDQALVEAVVTLAEGIEDVCESNDAVRRAMLAVLDDPAEDHQAKRDAAGRLEAADALVSRTVATLGPQLVKALAELGGTPSTRKELAGGGALGGRLGQLRSSRKHGGEAVD